MNLVLKSKRVLINNELKPAAILLENEKIKTISGYEDKFECDVSDFGDLIIMPGLVDTHVHVNEPGREEWEGFETATKAAIAGGITMIVDMPLNSSPVTTDVISFDKKKESAKNKLYSDIGFYGGIVPDKIVKLNFLIERGVFGLKAFMINSGLEEFPSVNENDLRKVFDTLKHSKHVPLLFHAETETKFKNENVYSEFSFKSFLENRPEEWENKAVELLIKLCREYKHRTHIVHVSSGKSVELIRKAKKEGLPLTAETCPHYLYFSSEGIPDNDTRYKCTPPIRDSSNREKLWEGVKDGTIDFIVSDHSPCSPELKFLEECNFEKAWGGISGLQFGLSVIWTEARKRNISIEKVSELMSYKTSEFIGLQNRKGRIEEGFDADIIIFDPDKKFKIEKKNIFHKHKLTPYSGKEFYGTVECTYLRGYKVFENGVIISEPKGKIILREN